MMGGCEEEDGTTATAITGYNPSATTATAASTTTGVNNNNSNTSSSSSPSSLSRKMKKKKLIAIMNDYTTKTVRVCVNNEEVVVTTTTSIGGGGGGGRNNLDEENNNGVDNMLSMEEYYKQDHNIEDIERSISGSTNTSMDILGPNNTSGGNNNGGLSLSRPTSTSSTAVAAALEEQQRQREFGNNNNDGGGIATAATTTNNQAPPPRPSSSSTSNENKFEASLLLGIAENLIGNNNIHGGEDHDNGTTNNPSKRTTITTNTTTTTTSEPPPAAAAAVVGYSVGGLGNAALGGGGGGNASLMMTLPSSMTSFLDVLTEDQRRKRHRYIPAVEGFRRLYKNEIKVDMMAARMLHRKRKVFDPTTAAAAAAAAEDVVGEDDIMEEDEDEEEEEEEEDEDVGTIDEVGGGGGGEETTNTSSKSENDIIVSSDKDAVPDKMAFIVPSEDAMSLANGGRLASLMVNTPFENSVKGPVGSGGGGTPTTTGTSSGGGSARSPQLVDSLTAFNPPRPQESTAAKTKHRLKRWEANPSEVEIDLSNYRKTVQRTRKELQAAENERGRIELVSAVMREHFQKHLIAYKEEIMAVHDQLLETNMGCLKAEERYNIVRSMSLRGSGKSMKDVLVTLTALEDELKNVSESGDGGDGSNVIAALPSEKSADWRVPGFGGVSTPGSKAEMASGWILEGDNVITPSGEVGEVIEVKVTPALDDAADKNSDFAEKPHSSSDKKEIDDAMDVDKETEEETKELAEKLVQANDAVKSADDYALVEKISVRLSNGDVKVFKSAELKFNPKKPPTLTHFNKALGKRWNAMLKTAEAGKHSHDLSAMDNYINASFVTDDSEDGNDTNTDDCLISPFGSDMIAAPESVRAFPSVIPPDVLEETVRKVVYEKTTPRIIPDIPADLKKYESQKEDLNRYQARVMQLRHRLGRQKRLRRLNERTLTEGKSRSHKVENLLLEMQMDLKNLKERLHGELSELGISNTVLWNGADDTNAGNPIETNDATRLAADADPTLAEVGLINNDETTMEPESKRLRVE